VRKHVAMLALVAVPLVVVAGAASAGSSSQQVFSMLAVSQNAQPINGFTFDRAPRAGDQVGIAETLYKWAGTKRGARVGRDQGIGTFLNVAKNSQTTLFSVQAFLGGGTMLAEGVGRTSDRPTNLTLPIVGGTGKYAGASGYVNVRPLGGNDGNNSNLEFHLLR
jgi:hypothetical protein